MYESIVHPKLKKMKIHYLKPEEKVLFLRPNRPVVLSRVTKLAKSITLIGNVRVLVLTKISFITGKPALYMVDGQHGYYSLLRTGKPIPYVLIEVSDMKDLIKKITMLNSTSKVWSLLDYVHAYTEVSKDYRKLMRYYKIYDFELGFIASVLMNKKINSSVGGSSISKFIKGGDFKVIDAAKSKEILDMLTDVLNIIPRLDRQKNKFLCSEYVDFLRNNYSTYNHKVFLKNLEKKKSKFILATHEETQLSTMFEKLL